MSSGRKTEAALALVGLTLLAAADLPAPASSPAPTESSLFQDPLCPFAVRFPGEATPPATVAMPNARTASVSRPGLSLAAACIADPATPGPLLEGDALHRRLSMLADILGVTGAKVTVPAPPSANCGLIEGQKESGGVAMRLRTQFCYAPGAFFIVETSSDGSPAAEEAVRDAIASVSLR